MNVDIEGYVYKKGELETDKAELPHEAMGMIQELDDCFAQEWCLVRATVAARVGIHSYDMSTNAGCRAIRPCCVCL